MTTPLVTVPWLRDNLGEVTVLDASYGSGHEAFLQAHIPGAHFADLTGDFSDLDAALPFTMPTTAGLRDAARAAGVRDGRPVVVYDRNGGAWAARVWWLLRVHGFPQVSVLDGGFGAWTAHDLPVVSGPADPAGEGELTLHEPGPVTADADEVARVSRGEQPGLLVCGLRQTVFDGPGGRIPGSVSLPYAEMLRIDGTLDLDRVRERAAALGPEPLITYCGGGINAAGLVLAFEAAGLAPPLLYDGSLTEWRTDPSRPLEIGTR